jgi:DNA-directed RNA polymerase subunit RPC12/RpoP
MLVTAAEFLTYREAVELYSQLQELEILALVKTCGPPTFPFGDGMYYQLLIEDTALPDAQEVLQAFAQQRAETPVLRCPRCGSTSPAPISGAAWWKRLFYAGTTLHKCANCGKEFPA